MKSRDAAILLLGTILEMSDSAQKQGGATSISGVAALHKMQSSIQKNRSRIVGLVRELAEAEGGPA